MKTIQLSEEVTLQIFIDKNKTLDGELIDFDWIRTWFDPFDPGFKNSRSSFYSAIFFVARFLCLQKKTEHLQLFWIDAEAPRLLKVTNEINPEQIAKFSVANPEKHCYLFKATPGYRKGCFAFDMVDNYFKKLAREDKRLRPFNPLVLDDSGFPEQRWASKPSNFCKQLGIEHITINSQFSEKPELSALDYFRSNGFDCSFCECASLHMAVLSIAMSAAFEMAEKIEPILLKLMENTKDQQLNSAHFNELSPKEKLINQFSLWRPRIFNVLQPIAHKKKITNGIPLTKVTNFQSSKIEQELLECILSKFDNFNSVSESLLSYNLIKNLYHPMPHKPEPNEFMVKLIISTANRYALKKILTFKPDLFERIVLPSGWPDLVIISKNGNLKMIEVKSVTDRISTNQKRFFVDFADVDRQSLAIASIAN